VRELCFYHFSITDPNEALKQNVIKRHITGDRDKNNAEAFYESSDLVNTKEIQENSVKANEALLFYEDINKSRR
jgi:pantothenate kinase